MTILAVDGSAPLDPGARMVVDAGGRISGSIGGGRLEWETLRQAIAILDEPEGSWRVQDYPLGPLLGQCCGGRVRMLVERLAVADIDWLSALRPGVTLESRFHDESIARRVHEDAGNFSELSTRETKPRAGFTMEERLGAPLRPIFLFGAGHVGQAIARALAPLPFALNWFDTRSDFCTTGATIAAREELVVRISTAPLEAALVVLTHDHGLDYDLVRAGMARPFAFVGVIGSETKKARFYARLRRDGLTEQDRERLVCPIGLGCIPGKDPAIIAVSVVAQLLGLPRT